jgi:hypothetical protein
VRLLLPLLLGLLPQDEQAARFYERTRFEKAEAEEEEGRRVQELILNKDHWIGAYTAVARKFGPFPEDLEVAVDFTLEGEELARTTGQGSKGKISFNLKKLTEGQKKRDELEKQRKEAEAQGGRLVFKVPPLKFERIVYHELTHVLQKGYDAPKWFLEGMAQLMGDDMNAICGFAVGGRNVRSLDEPLADRSDLYARGHLFWKWLDSQGAAKGVAELAVLQRRPWKEALEEATRSTWPVMLIEEREWSAKEVEKLK